jgi:hypothetical protein
VDQIDAGMAARFLAALSADNLHTFQTFDDAGKGRRGLTRILHGPFAKHADTLATLNANGAGVFVMVNRGDGRGRKADNVTGCRALFVDLDGSPIEPVLAATIPPQIVVESSPGKWHAYWPIADLPPAFFSPAQRALAALFAGDPKVHDKPRVMRLPGFLHRKGEPVQTRLERCQSAPLTWGEMAAAYGLAERLSLPDAILEGDRNDTLFKLARSAARKGVPEAQQLAKAQTVNAQRCHPPLPEDEVCRIVASAYREPERGILPLPLALLEAEAYKAADDAVRTLLLLAYRRADGFNAGCVTLPHSELAEWFPRKNTFLEVRTRAVESGLLTIARPAIKRMPRKGRGPKPNFYQLAIGPFSATYSPTLIGPFSATPEALQALGSRQPLRSAAHPKAKAAGQ